MNKTSFLPVMLQEKRTRFKYLLIILAVIGITIFSRTRPEIPLFIGDLLYAVMVFFIARFAFISLPFKYAALVSIAFCLIIELLQLCQSAMMISLRHTLFGKYVLGQGFLWSDIAAYIVGVSLAYTLDIRLCKPLQVRIK